MSDPIRHECGLAVVRLKKPLAYYQHTHGSALYGFNMLSALMTKQPDIPAEIQALPDVFKLMTRDAELAHARNSAARA